MKITIIIMRLFSFVLLMLTAFFYIADVKAQTYKDAFKKLSEPEKRWVLTHPFAAKNTYNISKTVSDEVEKRRKNDKDLDGDIVGGSLDAFKHTLWMALCSQKVGRHRALSLGRAHEAGNRWEFDTAAAVNKNVQQDSVMSRMDMLNNEVGAALGKEYKDVPYDEMVEIVKQNVLEGNCYKIKKKGKKFLDSLGNVIDEKQYKCVWNIPKVIIKSNE